MPHAELSASFSRCCGLPAGRIGSRRHAFLLRTTSQARRGQAWHLEAQLHCPLATQHVPDQAAKCLPLLTAIRQHMIGGVGTHLPPSIP